MPTSESASPPEFPVRAPRRQEEQVRDACRVRHYSLRTEEAYWLWTRRFVLFQHKRHPLEMRAPEIAEFLTALATERGDASRPRAPATACPVRRRLGRR